MLYMLQNVYIFADFKQDVVVWTYEKSDNGTFIDLDSPQETPDYLLFTWVVLKT